MYMFLGLISGSKHIFGGPPGHRYSTTGFGVRPIHAQLFCKLLYQIEHFVFSWNYKGRSTVYTNTTFTLNGVRILSNAVDPSKVQPQTVR